MKRHIQRVYISNQPELVINPSFHLVRQTETESVSASKTILFQSKQIFQNHKKETRRQMARERRGANYSGVSKKHNVMNM